MEAPPSTSSSSSSSPSRLRRATSRYENDDSTIWFKSNKANGYAFLSNLWPDVQPAARKAVYELFPAIRPRSPGRAVDVPEEEGRVEEGGKGSFSFVVDGVRYPTVEHCYHSAKYAAAHPSIAAHIRAAPTATTALQRNTAHKRTTPLPPTALTQPTLSTAALAALRAKFGQRAGLRTALLATGERVLAEVPGRGKESVWVGRGGQLGVLLMQVRSELREEEESRHQGKRKEVSSKAQEDKPQRKKAKHDEPQRPS